MMRTTLIVLSIAVCGTADAAPSRDEILAWMETYADATTLDDAPGVVAAADVATLDPYVPPGVRDEFAFDELDLEIEATQRYLPHRAYIEATERFRGQATLAADYRLENYAVGQPFSAEQIEQAAPDAAGFMVAWNHIHRWQNRGYKTDELVMNYVERTAAGSGGTLRDGFRGGGTITRFIAQGYYRVYLSHLAGLADDGFRVDVDDSDRLLWKDYIDIYEPFDLKGTRFVIERGIDADEEDQVNSYLPTERRVRRLSAKERADSFLGSNYSLDDFEGFSGRVMDFDWTYLGRKAILHVSNSREALARFHGPASRLPADRWQVRNCFVVEHRPKWDGHPIGSKLLFIDEDTWNVDLAIIFDREDRVWKAIQTVYRRPEGPATVPGETVSRWSASVALNFAVDDATVTRAIEPVEFPEFKASQIRRMFSVSSLSSGR